MGGVGGGGLQHVEKRFSYLHYNVQ